jgi:hypothetical protein
MLDTWLIMSNIIITIMGECRRSKCTDIEISDCLKIHREVSSETINENLPQVSPRVIT